ncbi:MAG: Abi-alpha family protein [Nocardioides sp.]
MDERLEQVPGIARIAAGAAWRSTLWTAEATRRTGRLVLRTVTDPEASAELLEEVARDLSEAARTVSTVARRIQDGTPVATALTENAAVLGATLHVVPSEPDRPEKASPQPDDLRARGARLLERSRDVWSEEETHPAFARILDDLAPDEARLLVHLAQAGPQPSVDVRTGGPVGMVSSQLLAPGLTMIGARAGVRYADRVPAYLNNLDRLGLVRLSPEPVTDPMDYQVLEAQPDVLAVVHSVKFAKVVRRSIHLTPFGEDFCRTCLVEPAPTERPPWHQEPPDRAES